MITNAYVQSAHFTMKSKVRLTCRPGAWIYLSDNRWINAENISEFEIHHVNADSTAQTGSGIQLKHTIRVYNCQKYRVYDNNLEAYALGILALRTRFPQRTTTSVAGLTATTSEAAATTT